MAINRIQFSMDLSLADLLKGYGTEAQCEAAFIKARWPHGFEYPCYGKHHAYEFKWRTLRYWQCGDCRHQTSLWADTIMEHRNLPRTK